MELALSRLYDPEGIYTELDPDEEKLRSQHGHPGVRNAIVPPKFRTFADSLRAIKHKHKPARFYDHAPAPFIRKRIDPSIWDNYFKFCFERNPWDKTISLYYWRGYDKEYPTVSKFIHSRKARRIRDWDIYANGSDVIVDRVYKYEELADALTDIRERLGLPEPLTLPSAKSGHRRDKRHYREVLSQRDRNRIARLCAPEIELHNYTSE